MMRGFAVGAGKQAGKRNAKISDFATLLHRYFATIQKCPLEKIPPRYFATINKKVFKKKYALTTSLLRYNQQKGVLKKNTPSLHRYFATTHQKMASGKKYPLASSLLCYNPPKSCL